MSDPTSQKNKSLSIWSVAALGIGSMVGAGIFTLLGQTALLVHAETWISFLLGGVVALFSGYSYSRLSARYPSSGGIIDFFKRGFPSQRTALALSLLYVITLVLTISMVSRSFGAYAAALLGEPKSPVLIGLCGAAILLVLTLVNAIGTGTVGRIELVLVIIKLGILTALALIGATTIKPELLHIQGPFRSEALISSVGLTFFAYSGYGMMANAAGSVADPARTMPRAFMLAIGVTITLYVVLAIVLLGNVPPAELARYGDTVLAEVTYPVLGQIGVVAVSLGALLATSSAINATLFSALNITAEMQNKRRVWREANSGFLVCVGFALAFTLTLNLGALANVASATFLLSYLAVFVAAWNLRKEIGASPALLAIGFLLMAGVFCTFLYGLARKGWLEISLIIVAVIGSWLLAMWMQRRES